MSTQKSRAKSSPDEHDVSSVDDGAAQTHRFIYSRSALSEKQEGASGPERISRSRAQLPAGLLLVCYFWSGAQKRTHGKVSGGKHRGRKGSLRKDTNNPTTADGEDYTPVRRVRRGREGEGEEEGASGAFTCHVRLAGPQGLKNQLQLPDSCGRLFSTGHVRLQDHFQEADPYQRETESA